MHIDDKNRTTPCLRGVGLKKKIGSSSQFLSTPNFVVSFEQSVFITIIVGVEKDIDLTVLSIFFSELLAKIYVLRVVQVRK